MVHHSEPQFPPSESRWLARGLGKRLKTYWSEIRSLGEDLALGSIYVTACEREVVNRVGRVILEKSKTMEMLWGPQDSDYSGSELSIILT